MSLSDCINCQIIGHHGDETYYKVRESAPLSVIFRAYSERMNCSMNTLCFQLKRTSEFLTMAEGEVPLGGLLQEDDKLILQ